MVKFEKGTKDLMDSVAAATKTGVTTVIGESNFFLLDLPVISIEQQCVLLCRGSCTHRVSSRNDFARRARWHTHQCFP